MPENEARLFDNYTLHPKAYDELFARPGESHTQSQVLFDRLGSLAISEFHTRRSSADLAFLNQGITFSVYSDMRGTEKIFPFDLIPRTIPATEWQPIEKGLKQRILALEPFSARRLPRATDSQGKRHPERSRAWLVGLSQGDDRIHAGLWAVHPHLRLRLDPR